MKLLPVCLLNYVVPPPPPLLVVSAIAYHTLEVHWKHVKEEDIPITGDLHIIGKAWHN